MNLEIQDTPEVIEEAPAAVPPEQASEELQDAFVGLKMTPTLKAQLEAKAKAENKSLGALLKDIAEVHLADTSSTTPGEQEHGTVDAEREALIDEAIRLHEREGRILSLIAKESRSGRFSLLPSRKPEAPEHLTHALHVTRERRAEVGKRLKEIAREPKAPEKKKRGSNPLDVIFGG